MSTQDLMYIQKLEELLVLISQDIWVNVDNTINRSTLMDLEEIVKGLEC